MSAVEPRDRLNAVLHSALVNGVDFVEVDPIDPRRLHVHFLNAVQPLQTLQAVIAGGDSIPMVRVDPSAAADWSQDTQGRPQLTLHLPDGPGDFSLYTLTLTSSPPDLDSGIDRWFNSASFSFKALCPSNADCAPAPRACPAPEAPAPNIDYTAKDFKTFVAALDAFSALRAPDWRERSEADFGRVMMEAMSALADEFSYYQDRVAAEATLATATQRRSLVSLARLVDYEPAPVRSATTDLLCVAAEGATGVPAGAQVTALGADGGVIAFEIGAGLNDVAIYPLSARRNFPIPAFWWDDSARCLPQGATELWVEGDDHAFAPGQRLLIQTDLPGESLRQIVLLTEVETAVDKLSPGAPIPVTRLAWSAADALTHERNLPLTCVGGNILPATQGLRVSEAFAIDRAPPSNPDAPLAIARRGPNASDLAPNFVHRHPLSRAPVGWLAPPPGARASPLTAANALAPEIRLRQTAPASRLWAFASSLLDAPAAEPVFTLDPAAWVAVAKIPSASAPGGFALFHELAGDKGECLRFGDGAFGQKPGEGDAFSLVYRVSAGAAGNVAADSVAHVDPAWTGILAAARNPFPATGGADAETPPHIRNIAPQQFQATQFRNLRPSDYVASAESLPWVDRAGCAFRWTGSWFSAFTVADPRGGGEISAERHLELVELLNRRRMAGRESHCPDPAYVSIDLKARICVAATSTGPQAAAAVLATLSGSQGAKGFFFADRFTFGAPLYRSALEAAIQSTPGVNGVLSLEYRQRGVTAEWRDLPEVFAVAPDRILRIDNNPDFPDRGMVKIVTEGGA